jgi:predicted DsbA family dithiol-disulfide isomerase
VKVEVWSDVVCPWCYIGKRRFTEARSRYEAETGDTVEVVYRPFMLDPRAPTEPEPVVETYAKKFGGPAGAKKVLDTVTAEAATEGLAFRMDIAKRANTLAAHRLLELALGHGVQEALKERLMAAYFTEGADVADHDNLVGYGTEVGLDPETARAWLAGDGGRAEVEASLRFSAANGIASVPTYVIDRRIALPGAQPADTFARILGRMANSDGPIQLHEPD